METPRGMTRVLMMFLGAGIGAAVWGILVVNSRASKDELLDDRLTDDTVAVGDAVSDAAEPVRLKPVKMFSVWQMGIAGAALAGAWPLSGYVGLGVAAAETVMLFPLFWKASKAYTLLVSREEALMAWIGNIRDMIKGGSNIKRALSLSASMGQPPIDDATEAVESGLRSGLIMRQVLFNFAGQVASPTADRLVAILTTASDQGASGIVDMLDQLIDDTRKSVTALREIIRERRKNLNNSRSVSVIFALMIVGAAMFMADIMQGYKGMAGQFILVLVMLMWGGCVLWLYMLNRPPKEYRLSLTTPEEQEELIVSLAEVAADG